MSRRAGGARALPLLLLAALALLALLLLLPAAHAQQRQALADVEAELALLEQHAAGAPSSDAAGAVEAAKAYAAQTVQTAVKDGNQVVEQANQEAEQADQPDQPDQPPAAAAAAAPAAAAADPAGPAGPAGPAAGVPAGPAAAAQPVQAGMSTSVSAATNAPVSPIAPTPAAAAPTRVSAADAAAQREKEREERQSAAARAEAEERLRQATLTLPPFRPQGLSRDSRGVYGGVTLGLAKADSLPAAVASSVPDTRTHMSRFDPHGRKKDIYGRPKACLKDIAAHFDEGDIYESKKMALQAQMEATRSRKMVEHLRRRLNNLETWHAMMQKKFLMSAEEEAQHEKRMERLFDAHLPQELKQQLEANKVAKRAAQAEPYPDAMARAKKILRLKRTQLAKDARLQSMGRKRIIRPEINDPEFPSMDPISSSLREQLWRRVDTDDAWSTDSADAEVGANLVADAHKLHGDFIDGPIAAPLIKDRLYNPQTEILGRPDFLPNFPWPKEDTDKITMNDKVKVEQSYYQTW